MTDVWDRIAERMTDLRRRASVEEWRVTHLSPLRLAEIGGSGKLEDGDDDIQFAQKVRDHIASPGLVVGDALLLIYAGGSWWVLDVLPDG